MCLRLLGPLLMNHRESSQAPEKVTPDVQRKLLAAAKALQNASNLQQTCELTAAVNILLQSLAEAARPFDKQPKGQQTLDNDQGLRLLQLLAVHRDAIEELLLEFHLEDASVVSDFDALIRMSDPFKASLSRSVLSRSGSASMVNRQREEKEFFAEHAIPKEFFDTYFAGPVPAPIEQTVRVAIVASNIHFGVPQKKTVLVGRDLVDWLLDTYTFDGDRAKATRIAEDMIRHELLGPTQKEKRLQPFVDGDKFYSFIASKIRQVESLFQQQAEDENDVARCERCGRQGGRVDMYCSICGHVPGEPIEL